MNDLGAMNILLVEDDFDVARNICEYFEAMAHRVEWAPDGLIGLDSATREPPDIILLDIGLPRLSGVELCRRLRNLGFTSLPIMMLTARGDVEEKVAAFDAGADDYLVKPFALVELASRIGAIRRRAAGANPSSLLEVAGLSFDTATCTVSRDGRQLAVTATGRKILEALMRNSHRVVTRAELEKIIWGDEPPPSDSLKIHIHSLREVIDKPFERPLLKTIRGAGYRLAADHDANGIV